MRVQVYCIIALCAAFIECGLSQPQFYAVNFDGSISNISFTSSVVDVLESSVDVTIPASCDNPLQCIPPQQNGTTALYIPNGNSSLILLEIQNGMLRNFNIISPCEFNDFAFLSSSNNKPLLIACGLIDDDSSMRYVHTDNYGARDTTIQRVPFITAVVSPIIVMIPRPDEGGADRSIVSISNQDDVVTFEVEFAERDIVSTSSLPCVPAHIQRHRASHIFILICEDNHPYLVNFTTTPVSFVDLPNSITALASNARYGLAIELSDSSTTVTIQEISSQPATGTRTIQLNTTVIYSADFAPGDRFAYIATGNAAIFINVDMALNGDEEFMYTMSVQLCSQCPSVVFLNNNTVVISSSTNGQDVLLKFFYLWPWPPQQIISRALNKQPRWYWFTPSADFFPTNDPTGAPDSLSGGAIAGITIAAILIIVFVLVGVLVTVALICRHISFQDKRKQEPVQPRRAAATVVQEGGTNQSGSSKMVTGYSMSSTQGSTQRNGNSSQEESKPHAVDNFQAEPSSQTKRGDNDAKPKRDDAMPKRDDAKPKRDDAKPKRDDATPKRDDALPKRDEIAVSAEKELKVYTDYYNKLKSILPAKNISGHLITKRIIDFEDEQQIIRKDIQSKEAASIVLQKITNSLTAGHTESFYKLLDIMKDHGELSCVELANQIRGELSGNTTTSQ